MEWDNFEFHLINTSAQFKGFRLVPKSLKGFKKEEAMIEAKAVDVNVRFLPLPPMMA